MNNLPLELLKDKDNLWYMDFDYSKQYSMDIDKRDFDNKGFFQNGFYEIPSTSEYIVKHSHTILSKRQIKKIKYMLTMLLLKQDNVHNTDFPIGYTSHNQRLNGLIIKYYPDTKSLKDITLLHDLDALMSYYTNDDNKIHNLFLLFYEVLNNLEEMIDNGIYYTDINRGNIVFNNNQSKIIDFDYRFVSFDLKGRRKDKKIEQIVFNFLLTVSGTLNAFRIYDLMHVKDDNINGAKRYLKEVENRIRRG